MTKKTNVSKLPSVKAKEELQANINKFINSVDEDAKKGEIAGLFVVALMTDGSVSSGWVGEFDPLRMLGAIHSKAIELNHQEIAARTLHD